MSLAIVALATGRPPNSIAQAEAAELAKTFASGNGATARLVPALFRRSKVERRSSVVLEPLGVSPGRQTFYPAASTEADRGPTTRERMLRYAEEAGPLAVDVSRRALQQSGVAPQQISHLITVTCTGFAAPGVDVALIRGLGLSSSIARTNIGFMGCHGAINGLRVAQGFAEADAKAVVLLCAVELCSLHFQYGRDPEKIVANALFGDGAGALIARSASSQDSDAWRVTATGSYLLPDAEGSMSWGIGDHGFEMTLSPRVPELIHGHLRPWLVSWLAGQELRLEDIRSWAIHPGGPRIVSAVAEALALAPADTAASEQILAECGNMSSPTILFILERFQKQNCPRPCLALGFGPGLTAEVALLR